MARPKEFDPAEALEKAMHLFWQKGYYDTSIRDLVEHTGVNYYGLYGEFENKHGLFMAALDLYRDSVTKDLVKELGKPGAGVAAIRRSFDKLRLFAKEHGQVGCLICNTAVELAPHDAEAADRVRGHMAMFKTAFAKALKNAQRDGEIAGDKDVSALAEFLATTTYSAGFLTRAGIAPAQVKRHIETALSLLA